MFHKTDNHQLKKIQIDVEDIEISPASGNCRTCLARVILLTSVAIFTTVAFFMITLYPPRKYGEMTLHKPEDIKLHNSLQGVKEALWKKRKPAGIENAHGAIALSFTRSPHSHQSTFRTALERDITAALKEHNMTETSWINEKLGFYLMALKTVCVDVRNFKGINLIKLVTDRMTSSREALRKHRGRLSLSVLGLCVHDEEVPQFAIDVITDDIGIYKHGPSESTSIAMALMCTKQSKVALQAALNFTKMELATTDKIAILAQEVQVLQANSIVFSLVTEKKEMLEKIVEDPHATDFDSYTAAQIIPVLVGKTFVDIKHMKCV